MRIDADHGRTRFEHPVRLPEGASHNRFVEGTGYPLLPLCRYGCDHGLVPFRCQVTAQIVEVEMADRALQPDVEEVGEIGIADVVVVRRVGDNDVLNWSSIERE